MMYIGSCIVVGTLSSLFNDNWIIPIILIAYAICKIATSIWYILEAKYLKNFTKEEERNKITFAYEFIGAIAASTFSILAGLLLKVIDIRHAYLIAALLGFASMVVVLDYMKTRFGLKPEEYSKEDIEFTSEVTK